jgi:hypothetical protein
MLEETLSDYSLFLDWTWVFAFCSFAVNNAEMAARVRQGLPPKGALIDWIGHWSAIQIIYPSVR